MIAGYKIEVGAAACYHREGPSLPGHFAMNMKPIYRLLMAVPCLLSFCLLSPDAMYAAETTRPNVLFIAVDDLNHWIGHFGRNKQTKTPNIDRLARMGVTFTNAQCAAPVCNPSRPLC